MNSRPPSRTRAGFTLLELIMALAASAVILAAIYGVFSRAVHLRAEAMIHARTAGLRLRAAALLRDDLRHALLSGSQAPTPVAATLLGSAQAPGSSFPGYLRFTTTTGRDLDDTPIADVQRVEYYIVDDPEATDRQAGLLVRTVDRAILAQTAEAPREEPLLHGLERMEVEFYDGTAWQAAWEFTATDPTLPQAVRVRLYPTPAAPGQTVPPIEILVPWTTQSFTTT